MDSKQMISKARKELSKMFGSKILSCSYFYKGVLKFKNKRGDRFIAVFDRESNLIELSCSIKNKK